MKYTKHLDARVQQRGIPYEAVQLVLDHSSKPERRPGNATAYRLQGSDYHRLRQRLKQELHLLERAKDVIVVEGEDGTLITTYRQDQ